VDVTTHGRATAVLNPYYLVLFSPAIQRQLNELAIVFCREGYLDRDPSALSGRDLALAVATAMQALQTDLGMPTALEKFGEFSAAHIGRAVTAAQNPQLEMKLKAMPVPMDAAMVERYLRPALEAAAEGTLDKTPTLPR
jgi:alcohol dehydrogenase class IV